MRYVERTIDKYNYSISTIHTHAGAKYRGEDTVGEIEGLDGSAPPAKRLRKGL